MKIKKIILMILVTLLSISSSLNVINAEGNVSYDGQADGFIFTPGSNDSPTELFANFKDVMPGDEFVDTITVKNNSKEKKTVKIYLRSLGSEDELLSQMTLSVKKQNEELFNDNPNKTGSLTDWVLLGEFDYGEETKLDLILKVSLDMGDEFQNSKGTLKWQFKVEEIDKDPTPDPIDPEPQDPEPEEPEPVNPEPEEPEPYEPEPTPNPDPAPIIPEEKPVPQTSTKDNVGIYGLIGLSSLLLGGWLIKKKKMI